MWRLLTRTGIYVIQLYRVRKVIWGSGLVLLYLPTNHRSLQHNFIEKDHFSKAMVDLLKTKNSVVIVDQLWRCYCRPAGRASDIIGSSWSQGQTSLMHAAEPGLLGEARIRKFRRKIAIAKPEESNELGTLRVVLRRHSAGSARAVCFGSACQPTVFRESSSPVRAKCRTRRNSSVRVFSVRAAKINRAPRSKIARIGAVEAVINTHLSVTNRSVEGFLFTVVVNRERFSTSLLFFVVRVLLISGPKQ